MRKPLFDRSQIGTPGHDALCAWLHEEIVALRPDQWPEFFRYSEDDHLHAKRTAGFERVIPAVEVLSPEWEFPIDGGAGFADIVVPIKFYGVRDGWPMATAYEWLFVFEVKTTITSVGDVLRQVNFYKTRLCGYTRFARKFFFVVCPSPKYQTVIESQGFHFVKAPEGIA